MAELASDIATIAAESEKMSGVSVGMAKSAQAMSDRAGTVAAAAEESSANTQSVAQSIETASNNLSTVGLHKALPKWRPR